MKKIEAVVKPFKTEAVKEALTEVGTEGMTLERSERIQATERSALNLPLSVFCPAFQT